ncbi:hypothetical protein DOY81_014926, partial [Sarcophaga bullata]
GWNTQHRLFKMLKKIFSIIAVIIVIIEMNKVKFGVIGERLKRTVKDVYCSEVDHLGKCLTNKMTQSLNEKSNPQIQKPSYRKSKIIKQKSNRKFW